MICRQNEQPGRGTRKRTSKASLNVGKKKRKNSSSEESEGEGEGEEDEEVEDEEGLDEEEGSDDDKNGSDGNKSDSSQSKDVPKHFHVSIVIFSKFDIYPLCSDHTINFNLKYLQSGNFVLLKSDVKWDGDTVTSKLDEINLWKIDGKALLQKFIPMESSGKILHKCTCVVSIKICLFKLF